LLKEPFGTRTDRNNSLRLRLPDPDNWLRVRFIGYPTRAGFRYGDNQVALAALFYSKADPPDMTPEMCLERFLWRVGAAAESASLELETIRRGLGVSHERWSVLRPMPKPADLPEGQWPSQKPHDSALPLWHTQARSSSPAHQGLWFVAAAAYPSWPGTCLVQGFGVDGTEHPRLARAILSRWLREGASRLIWDRSIWEAPPIEDQ